MNRLQNQGTAGDNPKDDFARHVRDLISVREQDARDSDMAVKLFV